MRTQTRNPRDANAAAINIDQELTRRACYLQQCDASRVNDILTFAHEPCYLRAKSHAEKFKGPMQRCNIGFKCQNKNISKFEQLLKESRIMFKIFWNNVKKETLLYYAKAKLCSRLPLVWNVQTHIFLFYCYEFNITKFKNVSYWLAVYVLFWKGNSGLKFPCFLFYAC